MGTRRTYYDVAFDDSLPARLVFLVHSVERRERVEKVVAEAFKFGERDTFKVMTLTFDEAPDVLASYLVRGILRPPKAAERPRIIAVDSSHAASIGRSMDEVETALGRMGTTPASFSTLRRFIHEEVCGKRLEGTSPKPEEGAWRATQ